MGQIYPRGSSRQLLANSTPDSYMLFVVMTHAFGGILDLVV